MLGESILMHLGMVTDLLVYHICAVYGFSDYARDFNAGTKNFGKFYHNAIFVANFASGSTKAGERLAFYVLTDDFAAMWICSLLTGTPKDQSEALLVHHASALFAIS